jgi:peroxiredoxin
MPAIQLKERAKPFTLTGVDDRQHSLADYAGKEAVAVIFSCNHCPYVKAWEDRMVQIQADYAARGVQFIVINPNDTTISPDDSFSKMRQRSQEKGFNFPYLFDESQEVAMAYGAERTPEVFLFDKGGTLSTKAVRCDTTVPSTTTTMTRRRSSSAISGTHWTRCSAVRSRR